MCGVDALPQDPEARLQALERWGVEQRRRRSRFRFLIRLGERVFGARRLVHGLERTDRIFTRLASRVLDRGLDTAGQLALPEHRVGDRTRYAASRWEVLPRALRYVGTSEGGTFVDFGCGKGRVVHQAAKRPFRQVIGVEVSPHLAEIARGVVAARSHQHRCRNVDIVLADATQFRVPDDLTIAYFYRPFGKETFDAVLRGILESMDRHPRRVCLIYVLPPSSARLTILGTGRFRSVKELSTSLLNPASGRVVIFEGR